jgi:hypothetical protein
MPCELRSDSCQTLISNSCINTKWAPMYAVWANSNIVGISLAMTPCRRDLQTECSCGIFIHLLDITRSVCKKCNLTPAHIHYLSVYTWSSRVSSTTISVYLSWLERWTGLTLSKIDFFKQADLLRIFYVCFCDRSKKVMKIPLVISTYNYPEQLIQNSILISLRRERMSLKFNMRCQCNM